MRTSFILGRMQLFF